MPEPVDPAALAELTYARNVLLGLGVALDEIERCMPPVVCTWKGTAYQSYYRNIETMRTQLTEVVSNCDNARAAIVSAIAVAVG